MTKLLLSTISVTFIFMSCQNGSVKNDPNKDKVSIEKTIKEETDTSKTTPIKNKLAVDNSLNKNPIFIVALTSNALQFVNSKTGSTSELAFGKPLDKIVELLNKSFESKVLNIGINNECGAGPLKMAVWKNGLTIIFKEQPAIKEWQFAGWYIGKPSDNLKTLQTMAGVGIGSTREEVESAYVIKIYKSTIGYEFSTSSGLYGIFDGAGKKAKITNMWSGLTCIFR